MSLGQVGSPGQVTRLKFHSADGTNKLIVKWKHDSGADPGNNQSKLIVSLSANGRGVQGAEDPIGTFRIDESGRLKFKWDCLNTPQRDQPIDRAIEDVRCSVLEIDSGKSGTLLIALTRPFRISEPLTVDRSRTTENTAFWRLPDEARKHLDREPLLLTGLVLHVPASNKQYTLPETALRDRSPLFDSITECEPVGDATLSLCDDHYVREESVKGITLNVDTRRPTKAEHDNETAAGDRRKKLEDLVPRVHNLIKRIAEGDTNPNVLRNAVKYFSEICIELDRSVPRDEDGKQYSEQTPQVKKWFEETLDIAQHEIEQPPTPIRKQERNNFVKSDLTISGSIYRVVGHDPEKSTSTKYEGGVIVKVLEIADQE